MNGTVKVDRQILDIRGQGAVSGAPKTFAGTRIILLGETTLNKLREQKRELKISLKFAVSGKKTTWFSLQVLVHHLSKVTYIRIL